MQLTNKLEQLNSTQKNAIAGVLMPQKFVKGQIIVSEGDDATSFYIIKQVGNSDIF